MTKLNYRYPGQQMVQAHGMAHRHCIPAAQRGVTLVVSLMFLLLLTIIGVTSMTTGTLQERMAGNTRDLDVALNAAESSLRFGEEFFKLTYRLTPRPEYQLGFGAASGIWQPNTLQVDDKAWWTGSGVLYNNDGTKQITEAAEDPRHYIEFAQFIKNNADPQNPGGVGMYKISARGVGVSGLATSVLQSHYVAKWD